MPHSINFPFYSDLSVDEREALLKASERRKYPGGSIVIYEGDKPEFLYFILKGSVKVALNKASGREIILRILRVGEYFGEMSAFDQLPRSATVITEEDSEFLAISHERFADIVSRNPIIAMKMVTELSLRLREANELISILSHPQVKTRVANVLLKHVNNHGKRHKNGFIRIPRPSLKEIASMSGTSRETVSRILNSFSKSGFLELSKQDITIQSETDLRDLAEELD